MIAPSRSFFPFSFLSIPSFSLSSFHSFCPFLFALCLLFLLLSPCSFDVLFKANLLILSFLLIALLFLLFFCPFYGSEWSAHLYLSKRPSFFSFVRTHIRCLLLHLLLLLRHPYLFIFPFLYSQTIMKA